MSIRETTILKDVVIHFMLYLGSFFKGITKTYQLHSNIRK